MPNYCENTLEIRGDRHEVDAFLRATGGVVEGEQEPIDFNAFVPYPESYKRAEEVGQAWDEEWKLRGSPPGEREDRPRDGFNSGGHGWCNENWGTKWNAIGTRVGDYKRRCVRVEFDTAWTPPRPWVLAASRRFPALAFSLRYWEGGNGFKGHFVARAGDALRDERGDYSGPRGG